ncbi:hypothetical protein EW145_g1673 [Phellinidium pouzarii]|uniref:Xylanolytic transcriptional activator regulatory domain-containing protein n=1 Tax=Phellinidium pouzarii TaxID=167371 RepID=A0A4S4LFG9_9AGAM|nr:hypothetical protein EW145_g1673 [Phellinidium pouzarii]
MDVSLAAPQQVPQGQSHARPSRMPGGVKRVEPPVDLQNSPAAIFKGPKRKRLVKRRAATATPRASYFASKECTYTDSAGKPVPAPHAPRSEAINPQSNAIPYNINSISASAPGITSSSYPSAETIHGQQQTQYSTAALSLSNNVPGSSYVGGSTSGGFATPVRIPHSGQQSHRTFSLDDSREYPSPRKRLKSGQDIYGRDTMNRFQREVATLASASFGIGTGFGLADPENSSLRSTNTVSTLEPYRLHIVRELVNLFFAHCHPHRLIVHATSFYNDLSRNRVPSFLLDAVCAIAAPLSQNPLVRISPVREAGQKFADAALAVLFDAEGRVTSSGVEAAQALVLLQTYKVYKEGDMSGEMGLFDLALRILHSLHDGSSIVAEPESLSSDELTARAIKRECGRRAFWLIHTIELLEYAEYLDSPALKTRTASELGHITRIATLLQDIEFHNVESPDPQAIVNCESQLEVRPLANFQVSAFLFDCSAYILPCHVFDEFVHLMIVGILLLFFHVGCYHLKYNIDNLRFQLSLWETNSNATLSDIRKRLNQGPSRDHQSALAAVPTIMNAIGPRARNSILMGSVLWLQYCGPHATSKVKSGGNEPVDNSLEEANTGKFPVKPPNVPELVPQLNLWIKEWEEFWGPTHMHGGISSSDDGSREQEDSTCYSHTSMANNPAVQDPSSSVSTWSVPDVVIDPVLRTDDEPAAGFAPQASPALSSTSTLRGRDHPSLPSLKSSGLLDVFTDDPLGRSSGASTPVKQSWSLSTSSSPRPPLLSPGLFIPAASGQSGSAPLSPQPHALHTGPSLPQQAPQIRMQAPDNHQHNGALPNSELITPTFQEGEPYPARTYGSVQSHVARHNQVPSYFEQASSISPHSHMLSSHGSEAPAARR